MALCTLHYQRSARRKQTTVGDQLEGGAIFIFGIWRIHEDQIELPTFIGQPSQCESNFTAHHRALTPDLQRV